MPQLSPTHDFEEKTFSKPTYCDYCGRLLWGITKQGVCCRVCGSVSHLKCQELAGTHCKISDSLAASRNIDIGYNPLSTPESIKSEPNIQSQPVPIQKLRSYTTSESLSETRAPFGMDDENETEEQTFHKQQDNKNLPTKLKRSNSADSITDYSSGSNKTKPLQYYATLPSLYSSSKPMEFVDIAPRAAKPISPTKPSFDTKTIQDVLISSVINVSNATKLPSDSAHPPLNLNTTTNNFRNFVRKCGFIFELQDAVENIILPPENSVDYLKNMQNIQNMMGMISDGYDAFVPLLRHVDWSNEYETLKITQFVIIILSILGLTVWLVPWRYIFAVVGLSIFIANTQLVKALIKEISPVLMQRGKILAQSLISFEEEIGQEDEGLIKRDQVDSNTAGSSST